MIKVFKKVLKSICRYRENITIDEMIEIIKNNESRTIPSIGTIKCFYIMFR